MCFIKRCIKFNALIYPEVYMQTDKQPRKQQAPPIYLQPNAALKRQWKGILAQ